MASTFATNLSYIFFSQLHYLLPKSTGRVFNWSSSILYTLAFKLAKSL